MFLIPGIKSNLSLYSLYYAEKCNKFCWAPSPHHCARATQLLSKKCRSGGEPSVTLCPIWSARDLNLRPSAPEMNALPPTYQYNWIKNFCIIHTELDFFLFYTQPGPTTAFRFINNGLLLGLGVLEPVLCSQVLLFMSQDTFFVRIVYFQCTTGKYFLVNIWFTNSFKPRLNLL